MAGAVATTCLPGNQSAVGASFLLHVAALAQSSVLCVSQLTTLLFFESFCGCHLIYAILTIKQNVEIIPDLFIYIWRKIIRLVGVQCQLVKRLDSVYLDRILYSLATILLVFAS
jgi:hypothetical protein